MLGRNIHLGVKLKKINEMKQIMSAWKNYDKKSNNLLFERVFYGSGQNYVTSTSDHYSRKKPESQDVLIYDDYRQLLGRPPVLGIGMSMICLTKDYVKKKTDAVPAQMFDILEMIFDDSRTRMTQEEYDLIEQRFEKYKEVHGQNIFTDDRLIIFNPYSTRLGDLTSISQQPRVSSKYSGQDVPYDISASELADDSGTFSAKKSQFPDSYKKDAHEDYDVLKNWDYTPIHQNVNWSIHDLGHAIFESSFEGEVLINDKEYGSITSPGSPLADIYHKADFYGDRKLDRIYNTIKGSSGGKFSETPRDVLDATALVDMLTPGVGPNDSQYSFFAKLFKRLTADNYKKISKEITDYCIENISEINPKVVEYFKLSQSGKMLYTFLLEIFKQQYMIAKDLTKSLKFICVSQ